MSSQHEIVKTFKYLNIYIIYGHKMVKRLIKSGEILRKLKNNIQGIRQHCIKTRHDSVMGSGMFPEITV